MWSEPPAEPPATGTLVGSAFSAATKSAAVWNGEAAGTTSASNSPVRRAIGVTSREIVGRLVGDDRADHDHAGNHQRIALAVPLVDELRQADRAAGAADIGDLRAGDQLLAAQHLVHGARRLVPAAAGRRRHEELDLRRVLRECACEREGCREAAAAVVDQEFTSVQHQIPPNRTFRGACDERGLSSSRSEHCRDFGWSHGEIAHSNFPAEMEHPVVTPASPSPIAAR